MKLLLDTHVFLWLNDDSERISETVKDLCSSGTHEFYLSMASPWEMQIKSQQVGWARFCQLSRMASCFISPRRLPLTDLRYSAAHRGKKIQNQKSGWVSRCETHPVELMRCHL
jgi:hypothetical protein